MHTPFSKRTFSFPGGSEVKASASSVGVLGSIPGLGRSPGEGKGYPLQYSGLENSMDCIVHRVSKSQTRLSDFHFHCNVYLAYSPWVSQAYRTWDVYSQRVAKIIVIIMCF